MFVAIVFWILFLLVLTKLIFEVRKTFRLYNLSRPLPEKRIK